MRDRVSGVHAAAVVLDRQAHVGARLPAVAARRRGSARSARPPGRSRWCRGSGASRGRRCCRGSAGVAGPAAGSPGPGRRTGPAACRTSTVSGRMSRSNFTVSSTIPCRRCGCRSCSARSSKSRISRVSALAASPARMTCSRLRCTGCLRSRSSMRQAGVAEDRGQQVVEIVDDAARTRMPRASMAWARWSWSRRCSASASSSDARRRRRRANTSQASPAPAAIPPHKQQPSHRIRPLDVIRELSSQFNLAQDGRI